MATTGVLFIKAETPATDGKRRSKKPLYDLVLEKTLENRTFRIEALPKRFPKINSKRIAAICGLANPASTSSLESIPNNASTRTAIKKDIAG